MKAMRTSMQLIRKASTKGWMRQLALYHKLKLHFTNSCIYNYRSRMEELASLVGVSPKTLYTYLKELKEEGLTVERDNNLILKSIRKINNYRNKVSVLLEENLSLTDITDLLYAKVLEEEGKKQAFMESIRRFERGDQHISKHGESPFSPSMSVRTIAKHLNVSLTKAARLRDNLNRLGVLKTDKNKPMLLTMDGGRLQHYLEDKPGYRFNIGSRLYEQYGDRHWFLQYPVYLIQITPRLYKRYIISSL
jgi:Mn-dependent DtxR family transcriptional regulator